jgi:hypothetical protein
MTKKIIVNLIEGTITISKAFNKRASKYGTAEYKELRNAIKENPTFEVEIKTSEKKSYKGLTFKRMEAYIKTQPNSEENLKEFEAVKVVAEAKGSKYPLTKNWFLNKFPEYKNNEVSANEMETTMNKSEHNTNTIKSKVA